VQKLFWLLFVTSVIWGTSLPGIQIPILGTFYPLRIMLLLIFVGAFLFRKRLISNTVPAKRTYILWLIILFYGFLTVFWSIDQFVAISSQIIYITAFLVIFTCIAFVKDKIKLIIISKSYLINVWIIGLLSIYESFSGNFLYESGVRYLNTYNTLGFNTPVLFFYNINNLATFMAISLPICFIASEHMKLKWLNKLTIFLLCTFVVFLIDSRAALIAIFIFLLLYLLFQFEFKKILIYLFLSLLVVQYFSDVIFQSEVWEITNSVDSDNIRIRIWTNTLMAASDTYFIGFGPGNGPIANNMFQYVNTEDIFAIHNYFLEILMELGFVGFICFNLWLFLMFWGLNKMRKRKSNNRYIYNLLLIFIFQYLILSICASSITEMYFIWLIFGLCVASLNFPKD